MLARSSLMFEWNTGAVRFGPDRYQLMGSLGLSLRVIPNRAEWLLVDLGVRESLAPSVSAIAARSTMPRPEVSYGLATEFGISVSILVPFEARRECVAR